MSALTIDQIDPTQIFFRETRSQSSGAKTTFISRHPTSSSPDYNLAFQLSPEDSWYTGRYLTKAKFGIDQPQQNSTDDFKRTISFTAEDPNLVPFLKSIEETVIRVATERSEELWGKKMDEILVRDKLMSVVKDVPEGKTELKPLIKTKIILPNPATSEQRNVTRVFVANDVIAPCDDHPQGKINLLPVDDPLRVVGRNTPCLAKVKVTSMWKSPIGFGISVILTHLVVWPTGSTDTVGSVFGLGGAQVNILPKSMVANDPFEDDMMLT